MKALRTKIPGVTLGILVLFAVTAFSDSITLKLAEELFEEQQWSYARIEALRAQDSTTSPEATAKACLIEAIASLRLGTDTAQAQGTLGTLWNESSLDPQIRSLAAYEAGLRLWSDDHRTKAYHALKYAFLNARDIPLFWKSGCSLYFFFRQDRKLQKQEPTVWLALQSCRDVWPREVWLACRPKRAPRPSLASLPGRWIVGLYRSQIAPAIGSRCDLLPSCSEYFLQASRQHGLLGIPIVADRFIREPSVVKDAAQPVVQPNGRIRYADPLSDHDFWLKKALR